MPSALVNTSFIQGGDLANCAVVVSREVCVFGFASALITTATNGTDVLTALCVSFRSTGGGVRRSVGMMVKPTVLITTLPFCGREDISRLRASHGDIYKALEGFTFLLYF